MKARWRSLGEVGLGELNPVRRKLQKALRAATKLTSRVKEPAVRADQGPTEIEFMYRGTTYRIAGKTTDPITQKIQNERSFYELPVLERLQELFTRYDREEGVIVDAGANIGNHTVFLSSVFPKAKVIAFEMNPETFGYLQKNLEENRLANAIPVNLGLSDREGSGGMRLQDHNVLGGAQVDLDATDHSIQLTTLDAYLRSSADLNPVGLIKIDVEGHELQCLHGAQETLKNDRPLVILECKELSEYATLLEFFKSVDYDLLAAAPGAMPNLIFSPRDFIARAFTETERAGIRADLCSRHVESWALRRKVRYLRARLEED